MYYLHIYKEIHTIPQCYYHSERCHSTHATLYETLQTLQIYLNKLSKEWVESTMGPSPKIPSIPTVSELDILFIRSNNNSQTFISIERKPPNMYTLSCSVVKEKIDIIHTEPVVQQRRDEWRRFLLRDRESYYDG